MNDNAKPPKKRKFLKFMLGFVILLVAFTIVNYIYFEKKVVYETNDSYWAIEQPIANAPLTSDIDADIVIIGGGFTGLSAAWHLAKTNTDKKIVLFEAKVLGSGASGRSGGMILPSKGPDMYDVAENQKAIYDISVEYMNTFREIDSLSGIDFELKLNGYAYAIVHKEQANDKKKYVDQASKAGIPLVFWDKEKTLKQLGSHRYEGAIYAPNGGSLHPMKFIKAIKKLCEDAGVKIYENSPVNSIEEGNIIKMTVGEKNHIVLAKSIVLATNAYTSKLGYFKGSTFPLHVQCAATRPLTNEELESLNWQSRLPFYDSRTMLYHLILTADNRIVIGGGNADYFYKKGVEYNKDMKIPTEIMLNELKQIYPQLKNITFDYSWNGVIGITMSGNPAYGVTGKNNNIYYAVAYNGHGVLQTILHGDIIAHLYNKQKHPWTNLVSGKAGVLPPDPFLYLGFNTFNQYIRFDDKKGE
jgi:glycine/D-amino acid oxidase-like deaminating enzyme